MTEAKDWRTYQRHDISARYPDLKGQAYEDFRDNMNKRKIRGRFITLYEGKVLDGWQLQRAAVELGIEPKYQNLREGEDPVEFVEEANEHRRHESVEKMCERAEVRRERSLLSKKGSGAPPGATGTQYSQGSARAKEPIQLKPPQPSVNVGMSLRAIAEREGVSESTVRRDLQKAGATSEEGDKVLGRDGKRYPSKRTRKKPSESGKPVFEWQEFFSHYGYLVRSIDRFGDAHKCKTSEAASRIRGQLQHFKDTFTEWVEFHTKEKAPRH